MEIRAQNTKVYLKTLELGDTDRIWELANDKDISYNMANSARLPYPLNRDDAVIFVDLALMGQMENKELHFGIRLPDNLLVGATLLKFDLKNRSAEIAYWVGKNYRRKGYTRDAIKLMLDFAFNKLKLNRIQAKVLLSNEASIKLLESIGFKKEGMRRQRLYHDGKFVDDFLYSILSSEFSEHVNSIVNE